MHWKICMSKSEQHFSSPTFPVISGSELRYLETRYLSPFSLAVFLRFPQRYWPFTLLPSMDCHGLLLSYYLCRIQWKYNSSCSACSHQLQDLTHLHLNCPESEPLRRAIFGTASSIFDREPDLGRGPTVGTLQNFSASPSLTSGG